MHTVTFKLGKAKELYDIFSFSPALAADKSPAVLRDSIEHAINQTMLRDGYYSAWAKVSSNSIWQWKDSDPYKVTITSPHHPVDVYKDKYPAFLDVVRKGHDIFMDQQDAIERQRKKVLKAQADAVKEAEEKGGEYHHHQYTERELTVDFLPPFGLSMAESNSIQLLHYPPAETLTYMDYLYSPTNRRWENLLGYNGYPGHKNSLVETIVDIGPMAAAGGSIGGQMIAPVLPKFKDYALDMLRALLRVSPSGNTTTPIVAYGGPVSQWLLKTFRAELNRQKVPMKTHNGKPDGPMVGHVFTLSIFGKGGPQTPVITANHPIKFNYYGADVEKVENGNSKKTMKEVDLDTTIILQQDLIAAGWQAMMAETWWADPDPHAVRIAQMKKWAHHSSPDFQHVFKIFREQVAEFSLRDMPEVDSNAWMKELKSAAGA